MLYLSVAIKAARRNLEPKMNLKEQLWKKELPWGNKNSVGGTGSYLEEQPAMHSATVQSQFSQRVSCVACGPYTMTVKRSGWIKSGTLEALRIFEIWVRPTLSRFINEGIKTDGYNLCLGACHTVRLEKCGIGYD